MENREATLSEWLEQYGDLINRTCCLILGDRALAEDAPLKSASSTVGNGDTSRAFFLRLIHE